jgi:hypothetical protein
MSLRKELFVRQALFVLFVIALIGINSCSSKKSSAKSKEEDIAAITKLENDQVKADLAGDISYYETNLADDFVHGTGQGTWYTKESFLKDLRDTPNNKIYKSEISNLTVHVYGCAGVATYNQVYEATVTGHYQQQRKVINTDVFVKLQNRWLMVASHTSAVR